LNGIGFHSSFDDLPYLKSDIFVVIDSTLDEIKVEDAKKQAKKR